MAPLLVPAGALALRRAAGIAISLWLGLAGGHSPTLHDRCGRPFGGIRPVDVSYLLATAREDTLPDVVDGERAGFGQLADLDRVSGAGADRVAAAAGGDEPIVLVPWGFDEGCRPIGWTGSWSWATPGVEGFYRGHLRSSDAWIGGRPTFDVYAAVWEGFPESPWRHPMSRGRPLLTASELFELYDRLPTAEAIAARPYGAVSELVTWRRDAGKRAEHYPARTLVAEAFDLAELARLRSATLPFAGTYRVRIRREGESLATFLLRTGSVGSEPLGPHDGSAGAVPTAPSPAPAYAAAVRLALDEAELYESTASDEDDRCSNGRGLRAASNEVDDGMAEDALHAWSAELRLVLVTACFRDIPVLGELRPADDTDEDPFAGVFRQEMDGRFSFRQGAVLEDGTPVMLVGDRIDLAALPPLPPLPTE